MMVGVYYFVHLCVRAGVHLGSAAAVRRAASEPYLDLHFVVMFYVSFCICGFP